MQEMWILDEMILRGDVVVIPTDRIPSGSQGFVVRRSGRASPALTLASGMIALVDDFRTPRRIVDAVMDYSEERDLDPEKTLDEVFPLFEQLLSAGLLRRLAPEVTELPVPEPQTVSSRHFVNDLLRDLQEPPRDRCLETSGNPSCSLAFGAAGIAFGLYRMSRVRREGELLGLAERWARQVGDDSHAEEAFTAPGLDEQTVAGVSPYHTVAGVHAVKAVIAQARADLPRRDSAVSGFLEAARRPCEAIDLYMGQAGALLGTALLASWLGPAAPPELYDLGREKAGLVRQRLRELEPIRDDRSIGFLGIAHGWGGLLYALLVWTHASGDAAPSAVPERLAQLADLGEDRGRSLRWPRNHGSTKEPRYFPTWCNGAAGLVHLWVLAHRVYGEERYLELAERSAWNAWEEGEPGVDHLCCGFAGRAYALLSLYRSTRDRLWLRRARRLAEAAVRADFGAANGLYDGRMGKAVLVTDLMEPESAAMPFFELDDSP